MSKHTRAPWKKGNNCIIAEIDRQVPTLIAKTGDYGMGIPAVIPDDEEAEANERLMIAAPEMLEALEMVIVFEDWERYSHPGHEDGLQYADVIAKVRSVIAKAKGETP